MRPKAGQRDGLLTANKEFQQAMLQSWRAVACRAGIVAAMMLREDEEHA